MLTCPRPSPKQAERRLRLERCLARAKRGSARRRRIKRRLARVRARETDRRKDWIEQTTSRLARQYDILKVEDLNVRAMTRSAKGTVEAPGRRVRQKAGLNRSILAQGWGLFVQRLLDKAPGRVRFVDPKHTSQRCSACGHIDPESARAKRSPVRRLRVALNADLNAARISRADSP